jgi:hypothetical protein
MAGFLPATQPATRAPGCSQVFLWPRGERGSSALGLVFSGFAGRGRWTSISCCCPWSVGPGRPDNLRTWFRTVRLLGFSARTGPGGNAPGGMPWATLSQARRTSWHVNAKTEAPRATGPPRIPARGQRFADPTVAVVWAAVQTLPEASKHTLLLQRRGRRGRASRWARRRADADQRRRQRAPPGRCVPRLQRRAARLGAGGGRRPPGAIAEDRRVHASVPGPAGRGSGSGAGAPGAASYQTYIRRFPSWDDALLFAALEPVSGRAHPARYKRRGPSKRMIPERPTPHTSGERAAQQSRSEPTITNPLLAA